MNAVPYPGYEYHLNLYQIKAHGTNEEKAAAQKAMRRSIEEYTLPEGMTMEDRIIPGGDGQDMTIRIYTPSGLPENAPIVMDIHGGGFVGGSLNTDNYRCICLASGTPALVVSVDYRLAAPNGVHFPQPLMDCYAALTWLGEHGAELGGDPKRIALHGTSAGGNLCASLALYVRDHGGPRLSLVVLNCPVLSMNSSTSKLQYPQFALGTSARNKQESVEYIYLGGLDGTVPPYYAFPDYCQDLSFLPPHYIVVGEYDTLRDDGLRYATRLMETGVPCELIVAPRVGHGFCVVDHPLTHWVHKGICGSLRREFGMNIVEF